MNLLPAPSLTEGFVLESLVSQLLLRGNVLGNKEMTSAFTTAAAGFNSCWLHQGVPWNSNCCLIVEWPPLQYRLGPSGVPMTYSPAL